MFWNEKTCCYLSCTNCSSYCRSNIQKYTQYARRWFHCYSHRCWLDPSHLCNILCDSLFHIFIELFYIRKIHLKNNLHLCFYKNDSFILNLLYNEFHQSIKLSSFFLHHNALLATYFCPITSILSYLATIFDIKIYYIISLWRKKKLYKLSSLLQPPECYIYGKTDVLAVCCSAVFRCVLIQWLEGKI